MRTPRQELLTLHNCLKEARNAEVNFWSFVRRSRCDGGEGERETQAVREGGRGRRERDRAGYFYWAKSVHLCLTSTHITAPTEHTQGEGERVMPLSITQTQSSQCNRTTGRDVSLNVPISVGNIPVIVCYYGKYSWLKLSSSRQVFCPIGKPFYTVHG